MSQRPDLVISDIRMASTHMVEGLTAAAVIRTELPGVAVVVLSPTLDQVIAGESVIVTQVAAGCVDHQQSRPPARGGQ